MKNARAERQKVFTATISTYTYDTVHKNAVASLSTGESYGYDANGNMTQRVENGLTYAQVFDAENRLVSVTVNNDPNQITQFAYDGNGNLVKKVMSDGSKTIYSSGVYKIYNRASTRSAPTLGDP